MVLKKVCCLSLRMGSLVLLYIYLIGCVLSLLIVLPGVGHPRINKFSSENDSLFYTHLFLSTIVGLKFLATIISITKKTPSNSLLIGAMSTLVLKVIFCVFVIILLYSNDVKNSYNEMVNEDAQKLIINPKDREKYVEEMHAMYGSVLAFICLVLLCNIGFDLYAILVFYSYMAEIKENIANNVPRDGKANPEEGYGRLPPPYTSQ